MATLKDLEELEKRLEKLENELKKYKKEENEEDENTLLQKVNTLKFHFFQIPENKEEYKTWKEKFKESYTDFTDYIYSIAEPEEEEFDEEELLEAEEDVDFLFDVINYCFSVIPQNEEQQECINKRFASALKNIVQKLKYKINENGEIEMPF